MERSEARALAMLARQTFDERWDPDSEAAARLADSTEAIDAAVEALLDAGDLGMAAMLLGALSSFWQEQGLVDQGRAVTKSALKRVEGNEDWQDWGRVQLVAAELAFRQGDQSEALNLSRHALAASRASRDLVLEADVETNLARIAFRDGDADRMFSHASRVGDLAGEDLRLQSKAVHMLGWAEYTSVILQRRYRGSSRTLRSTPNSTTPSAKPWNGQTSAALPSKAETPSLRVDTWRPQWKRPA